VIVDLKPYPAMKNSAVPWLGDVPEHWEVRRIKHICRLTYGDALSAEARHGSEVAVYGSNGRVGFHSVPNTMAPCLVIGRKGSFGKVNFSSEPVFAIDTTFFVDSRTSSADIRWLYFLLGWLRLDAISKDSAVPGLDREDAYQRAAPLPPLPEQAAIVRFLDYADRRIRRYIRAKQKLIKLLEEQKQAIIHRAVTRGHDSNVRLKPSGVEWLGDVPEHWEVRRAKTICSAIVDCKNRTPAAVDGGPFWVVRTTCIRRGQFDLAGGYPTDETSFRLWTARGAPHHGDVFFTREAPAGEACLVPDRNDLCMGQRMMYFRPDPELLDAEFLLLSIYGPLTRTYIELATNGSTVGHLRLGQVYGLPILWCPVEEQRAIVRYVQSETKEILQTQVNAEREISLLREYRTRLIADVVTGKLDVREAAAQLPDETEDTDWLDDFEPESVEEEAAADSPEDALEGAEA